MAGYLQTPNELHDALAAADLTLNEHRVFAAVVRQSVGFGRKDTGTWLSLSFLTGYTRASRSRCIKSLKGLRQKGLIRRVADGDKHANTPTVYAPVMEPGQWSDGVLPDRWMPLGGSPQNGSRGGVQDGSTPGVQDGSRGSTDLYPPKETREDPTKKTRKSNIARFADDSDALVLSEYLRDAIASHSPGVKEARPDARRLQGWAVHVDRLLRIDGATPEKVRAAIDSAHRNDSDTFWRPNILSGKKLREKFSTLVVRAAPKKGSPTHQARMGTNWDHLPEITEL
jgi:hypothetical protein